MSGTRFKDLLYRALNPVYERKPLSGRGAALYGGRFNPKGREAIYTALAPETAIREANQAGALQPTTLVAYTADIRPIFDTRDADALARYDMTAALLGDPGWRDKMNRRAPVPTQQFAKLLIEDGYAGLLVRSFARGADEHGLNLVLWRWNTGDDDRLELIDDEGRLAR